MVMALSLITNLPCDTYKLDMFYDFYQLIEIMIRKQAIGMYKYTMAYTWMLKGHNTQHSGHMGQFFSN